MKERSQVTIHYGEKDADLISWIQLLPDRRYSFLVKQAILTQIKGKTIDLGTVIVKSEQKAIRKTFKLGMSEKDKAIKKYLSSLREYTVSETIKNILRRFITFKIHKSDVNYVPAFYQFSPFGNYEIVEEIEDIPTPIKEIAKIERQNKNIPYTIPASVETETEWGKEEKEKKPPIPMVNPKAIVRGMIEQTN